MLCLLVGAVALTPLLEVPRVRFRPPPSIMATLAYQARAWGVWLRFAVDVAAITEAEQKDLWARVEVHQLVYYYIHYEVSIQMMSIGGSCFASLI